MGESKRKRKPAATFSFAPTDSTSARTEQLATRRIRSQEALRLVQLGRLDDAEIIYRDLLEKEGENEEALCNLAFICGSSKRWQEAADLCQRILTLSHDHYEAHTNLAAAKLNLGDTEDAILLLRKAARLRPNEPTAHSNLGKALQEKGLLNEAIACYNQAITINTNDLESHRQIAACMTGAGHYDRAIHRLRLLLARDPEDPTLLADLGVNQYQAGDVADAMDSFRKALEKNPENALCHCNLGVALVESGEIRTAIHHFETSVRLDPGNAESHYNSSMAYLYFPETYSTGWKNYEWRFKRASNAIRPDAIPSGKIWDGSPLSAGDCLLVVSEQGYGDTLQFMRYLHVLRQKHQVDVLLCAPAKLHGLIRSSGICKQPLTPEQTNDRNEPWISMMSLPGRLGVTPQNVLWEQPYIRPATELIQSWSQRLREADSPVVALNWQGNPDHERAVTRGRSLPLEAFAPLAVTSKVRFLSLQKGFGSEQLQSCSFRNRFVSCQELVDASWDFHETAAIIANCDLVISSDTAVAHLAAGMGQRTWLLLKKVPEWRWGLEGERSFWYPSMRLFRQRLAGDWGELMQRVAIALQEEFGNGSPAETNPVGGAEILAPISLGELVDKITILEIKRQQLTGQARENVIGELQALTHTFKQLRIRIKADLVNELRQVNASLWRLEDEIRDKERLQDFGGAFIELARSVYRENDRRAAIKREINSRHGSRIQEEKSYRSY